VGRPPPFDELITSVMRMVADADETMAAPRAPANRRDFIKHL
jgi:hypothetical protein